MKATEGDAMTAKLNHTIVHATDSRASAAFVAELLGFAAPTRYGPFQVVDTGNEVSLDFIDAAGDIAPQHYAFLVDDAEFDEVFGRIQERGLPYWADPGQTRRDEINHGDGGRGCYFEAPDGHLLEIITRPYGSGG